MKSTFRLLALLTVCVSSLATVAVRAADDLRAMTGRWTLKQAELAGRPMPPAVLKNISLTIEGANYTEVVQTEKGPSADKGTLQLEPGTNPKSMTVTGVEGPNAGKNFPAIYELDGDTLRIPRLSRGGASPPRRI